MKDFAKNAVVACGWSQNIPPNFIEQQRNLVLFFKDGYSFFKTNAELLTRRLANSEKSTIILIVHPDSSAMNAIANMDDHKAGHPESQQSDCLQAIKVMQGIRNKLLGDGKGDCAERTAFVGHHLVPTWNGAIGDNQAFVNLYTTRPYRGKLASLHVYENGADGGAFFSFYVEDCKGIVCASVPERGSDLWSYQLPKELADLRR